jgi:hypothetical protein
MAELGNLGDIAEIHRLRASIQRVTEERDAARAVRRGLHGVIADVQAERDALAASIQRVRDALDEMTDRLSATNVQPESLYGGNAAVIDVRAMVKSLRAALDSGRGESPVPRPETDVLAALPKSDDWCMTQCPRSRSMQHTIDEWAAAWLNSGRGESPVPEATE